MALGHHVYSERKNFAFVIDCFKICPKGHHRFQQLIPPSPHRDSLGHDCDIYRDTLTQLVCYRVTSCSVKRLGHRQLNIESKSTNNVRRPRLLVWLCGCWQASLDSPIRNTKCVSICPDNTYTLHA